MSATAIDSSNKNGVSGIIPSANIDIYNWNLIYSSVDNFNLNDFRFNFNIHSSMMTWPVHNEVASPIYYVKIPGNSFNSPSNSATVTTINAASNISAEVIEYYEKIERQLLSLMQVPVANDSSSEVEPAAIKSALSVVDMLKRDRYSPPAISWHGGDAIVMLWAIANATYAITVTDGELGYVVRRDKKKISSAHSIAINAFRLSDLR